MYTYHIVQWLAFFYIYCFIGWCIETTYVSLRKRKFVNRGYLRSPMLPIYGSGAVIMLICTIPVKSHPVLVFFCGMIGASMLEYITGWAMEAILKVRYWDYTGNFMNLNGHICLGTSIAWGFLSVLMTYFIHEPIEGFVLGLNHILLLVLVILVTILFLIDFYYSTMAAMDLAKVLSKMKNIRDELDGLAYQIKKDAGETLRGLTEDVKEEWEAKRELGQKEMDMRIALLNEQKEELIEKLGFFKKQLIRSNPTATSKRFSGAMEELRDRIETKIKQTIEDLKERDE